MKNCYIHIPFCKKICSYCDFCKMIYNEKFIDSYLNSLDKEIESLYDGAILETIYIGGGTPSCLSYVELEKLFKILSKFKTSKNLEYTIECNFDSIDEKKLDLFKKYGINRISFGIESINNKNLKLMDRDLDYKHVIKIINYCKNIGLDNINVDLIYALPNETMDILNHGLDFILSLDIPHISTYSLIIEEHTKMYINNFSNISEDLDSNMYDLICKRLKNNDYDHYEISNFCKKGFYSRHNTAYWNNYEYYGFGLGAASYINKIRRCNTKSINKYINGDYLFEEELVDFNSDVEYQIILNLRKKEGINLLDFYDKFHVNFNNICDCKFLLDNNLLKKVDNNIFIPEDKWYISNEIMVKLLEGVSYE